jgi:transcriptional regulator with XRE-family HTH domain
MKGRPLMEEPKMTRPNWRLTRERELRGWSQEELAGQIQAHPKNVGRWERGEATPSKFYQKKLCELFGKNAVELGFLAEEEGELSKDTPIEDQQLPLQGPPDTDQAEDRQESGQAQPDEQARNDQGDILHFFDQSQQTITHSQQIVMRLQNESYENRSLKAELKDVYLQLLTISEARLNYAGTVEALRRFNGEVAYERLPTAKSELAKAEQTFDEAGIRRTLALLDTKKVWFHYYKASQAFYQYKERTKILAEEALQPLSPLSRRVPRLDVMNKRLRL